MPGTASGGACSASLIRSPKASRLSVGMSTGSASPVDSVNSLESMGVVGVPRQARTMLPCWANHLVCIPGVSTLPVRGCVRVEADQAEGVGDVEMDVDGLGAELGADDAGPQGDIGCRTGGCSSSRSRRDRSSVSSGWPRCSCIRRLPRATPGYLVLSGMKPRDCGTALPCSARQGSRPVTEVPEHAKSTEDTESAEDAGAAIGVGWHRLHPLSPLIRAGGLVSSSVSLS
jgi:hypothetical protein